MTDPIKELNKEFNEKQRESDVCGDNDCYAPKYEEIPTKQGINLALCPYHFILIQFSEEDRDNKAQELFNMDFKDLQQKTQQYNKQITGEQKEEEEEK